MDVCFKRSQSHESLIITIQLHIQFMNVSKNPTSNEGPTMCTQCSTFYGAEAFGGLCSSCHKKDELKKKEEIKVVPEQLKCVETIAKQQKKVEVTQQDDKAAKKIEQADRKRCFDCSKKVGLLGVECKCGYVYCAKHRLPEEHKCTFDHNGCGKHKLKQEMVKLSKVKLEDI